MEAGVKKRGTERLPCPGTCLVSKPVPRRTGRSTHEVDKTHQRPAPLHLSVILDDLTLIKPEDSIGFGGWFINHHNSLNYFGVKYINLVISFLFLKSNKHSNANSYFCGRVEISPLSLLVLLAGN